MITSLGANPWRTPSFETAPWRDTHLADDVSEPHHHLFCFSHLLDQKGLDLLSVPAESLRHPSHQYTLHKVELVPLQLHRNPMLLSHAPVLRSSIINIITDHSLARGNNGI